MPKTNKQRGRPVKHPRPERIDATPEDKAKVVLRAKPKQTWRFEQERENRKVIDESTPNLSSSENL